MTDLWELPAEWHWATMGEVAKVDGGSTPKTGEPSYWGGDIPWITPDDLSGFTGKYIERGRRSITQAGYDSCSTQMVPAGTVLFTSRAPIGYVAIARNPVCTNQGFKSFICGPAVDPEYVFWYLRGAKLMAEGMASGTTFLELSGKAAAAMPIPVPSLNIQRLIVSEVEQQFTRLAVAGDSLHVGMRKLDRYRSRFLQQIAERGASAGRLVQLGEVADIQGGIQKQPKRLPRANHYPFLRVANVLRGRLDLREVHRVELFGDELNRLRLARGDLLIVEGNGSPSQIGRMATWDGSIDDCVHQNHIIRARLGSDVLPEWVEIVWNSPVGQEAVRAVASSTSGLYTLSVSKVGRITFPVPPVSDQRALAEEVSRALSVADRMRTEIASGVRKAALLGSVILMAAFRGTLRPAA